MPPANASTLARVNSEALPIAKPFLVLLTSLSLVFLLSWPIIFSLDLWVFKDKSSFLNLDYLLDKHLRLGVDAYYSYGLLPVFLQHVLFEAFGRGFGPVIGCTVVTLAFMALFWALLLRHLPQQTRWLVSIAALSPLLYWVTPNLPYSLAVLSMLFALLFVLKGRFDIALAASVVGCFSVPSLPLLLTALLTVLIVVDCCSDGHLHLVRLARQSAPGACLYLLLMVSLGLYFGFKSVLATALPTLGMQFYRDDGLGTFGALMSFLHPPGESLQYYIAYYIGSPVTWFAPVQSA